MPRVIVFLCLLICLNQPVLTQIVFKVDTSQSFQTIRGFGAADAWANEYMKHWTDSVRNLAADWLFSREINHDGSFKGIGLSIWRFNIGAGSAEQGDSSGIGDSYRRTEAIINPDGTFSENKQTGTSRFLVEAKERGLENAVMFSNSPPVYLTKNNRAYSGICNETNLAPGKFDSFADYLSKSLLFFEEKGIHFDYVSPVNEPQWDWCQHNGQEGSPWYNADIAGLTRSLDLKLSEYNISTKIQITESGLLLYANSGNRFKPGRQDEIDNYFNKKNKNYLGNLPHLAPMLTAHSYFTEWPIGAMRKVRKKLARKINKYGIEYWMSEYCVLKQNGEITGNGRDLGMHTALYVSRVIHHDLVYGNASSWSWWLGVSTADYKDGLVYADREGKGVVDSKLMWAMGNFSQFIRPGFKRINVEGKQNKRFFVSAYSSSDKKELVLVVINMKSNPEKVRFKDLPKSSIKAWETSQKSNLEFAGEYKSSDEILIAPQSISTLVVKL